MGKDIVSVLEIDHAKEISGKIELPSNPDYFFITLCITLATETTTHIRSLTAETPLIKRFKKSMSNYLQYREDKDCFTVSPVFLSYPNYRKLYSSTA